MPIREYQCRDCGHQLETLILRASDREELRCEQCGSADLDDVMSAPAVMAYGGGGGGGGGGCGSSGFS